MMEDSEFWARVRGMNRIETEVLLTEVSKLFEGGVGEASKFASKVFSKMAVPEVNPFLVGLIRSSEIPEGEAPPPLWFGLYRSSVTLFVGETGAGKSSLLYNIAVHAARNEPLFDIPFQSSSPLRVLYIDPENAGNWAEGQGGNCSVKLERIGAGRPPTLDFHNGEGVDLSKDTIMLALEELLCERKYDLVILDPIANLFGTKEENSNSEAAEHFTRLKTISRKSGACIVAVHHTGKGAMNDYGRGASARLASADVGLMFRYKGEEEERDDTYSGETQPRRDICRLQITKNRLAGKGSLYLRMAGDDRFLKTTFTEWRDNCTGEGRQNKSDAAEGYILSFLRSGEAQTRQDIIDAVSVHGIGRINIDKALQLLSESNRITIERLGKRQHIYRIVNSGKQEEKEKASSQMIAEFYDTPSSTEKMY